MTITRRLTRCFFGLALLSACTTEPKHQQQFQQEQAIQADVLMSRGQHKQAARLYQNLAQTQPTQQNQYNLMAADALIRAGDHAAAKQRADSIDPSGLSERQRQQLYLIQAQIDLSQGSAEQALQRMELIRADLLSNKDRAGLYRSQAFAYSLTDDLLASAKARIQLSTLLTDPQEINENNESILETLKLLPRQALILNQPPPPDELGGWMALADLLKKTYHNRAAYSDALLRWRHDFPNHPANTAYLQSYRQGPGNTFKQPTTIAVLLPESGPYAQAGAVIREGMMAAYQHRQLTSPQPPLRFYDSHGTDPVTLYTRAVAEGADLVIGPLEKEHISTLAAGIELKVPVLALNHVDALSKSNLFQFGLSPIDEAREVAAKAWRDGHRKILIFTPQGEQGERIARYFTEEWESLGGEIAETQFYNPRSHDFSRSITKSLSLGESENRYRQLRNLLGRNLEFTPRRRHDVDAIFINAYPNTARSLNPQLRFYQSDQLPVYATPQVYIGAPNPARDIDLNGITFCDIPWLFEGAYPGEFDLDAANERWRPFPSSYRRLIALGIDAYDLVAHLQELDTVPYQGATGNLTLNFDNRIARQLVCPQFSNGFPRIGGYFGMPPVENFQESPPEEIIETIDSEEDSLAPGETSYPDDDAYPEDEY